MANPEHIAWLLEGVESWNQRREKFRLEGHDFEPDFEDTDLYEVFRYAGKLDLYGEVPLAGADLSRGKFANSNFGIAILTNADLHFADLSKANLQIADLTGANLWWARLSGTKLQSANLTGANLTAAEPWKAKLYNPVIFPAKQFQDDIEPIAAIEDVLARVQRIKNSYSATTTLYFRGERECGWELRPSVMRSELAQVESEMLTDLMTQRPGEFVELSSSLAHWVLAQHHGLQTRFLDITKNPLVALFHASENIEPEEQSREDGCLHVFAVPRALVRPFNSDLSTLIANFAKLHRREQDGILGKTFDMLGNKFRYENEREKAMRNLYQMIRQEKPHIEEQIDPRDFYRVFVVEPQLTSERIRAQSGAFLVSAFHDRFERTEILMCNEEIPVYAHYRITVSAESKAGILESLKLLNITNENLFPGLDSSAYAVTVDYITGIRRMREDDRQRRASRDLAQGEETE